MAYSPIISGPTEALTSVGPNDIYINSLMLFKRMRPDLPQNLGDTASPLNTHLQCTARGNDHIYALFYDRDRKRAASRVIGARKS